ncbi:hypothetical protein [Agathobaculum desmolans]|uniref:hypothetical protein n=1 Tax=Agathobaculum desmolans TaxID=39484 RepID=UPI00248EC675|nr:hypothetical protein [Agathobaculum desmolans]
MSMADRAAQFSALAALVGHDAAISETARLTDRRIDLDDAAKDEIANRLQIALDMADMEPVITVTHFVPDKGKDGGAYAAFTGELKTVDPIERTIIFQDKTRIRIDDIFAVEGTLFAGWGAGD